MLGSPIGAASRRVQTLTNYRASKPTATAVKAAIFTNWKGGFNEKLHVFRAS